MNKNYASKPLLTLGKKSAVQGSAHKQGGRGNNECRYCDHA